MSRALKMRVVCFAVVFASVLLVAPSDYPLWLRLAAILVPALTFVLQRDRNLVFFASSYIPAIFLLVFFDQGRHVLLPLVTMVLAVLSIVFINRFLQPELRPGTNAWVGTLMLAEILTCEILIFVL